MPGLNHRSSPCPMDAKLSAMKNAVVAAQLLYSHRISHSIVEPIRVIFENGKLTFDYDDLHRIFHRCFGLHFNHALWPAWRTKRTSQRHRTEQEVFLLFTGLKRHHEALNALGLVVQGQNHRWKRGQQSIFDCFGLDIAQHRPRQHISALRQRGERAVGAVHTGTGSGRDTAGQRRCRLRPSRRRVGQGRMMR